MDIHPDEQVDPRLAALDRWLSTLHWYEKLPLVLSVAILIALPAELVNMAERKAVEQSPGVESTGAAGRRGIGLLPDMVRTSEIYVVACRNAGKPPGVARTVAMRRADKIANQYGAMSIPKLVTDRIEEQIRKHYGHPPSTANGEVILYRCEVR